MNHPASATLFERPLPPGYLEECATRLSEQARDKETALATAMVFRIGPELLALPMACMAEVTDDAPVHRIPHRDARLLLGIANVRGRLIPCVDLAYQLDISSELTQSEVRFRRRTAVVQKDGLWAFPVAEMTGMLRYNPDALEPVPDTVEKSLRKFTLGVVRQPDQQPIGLLDHELLFYTLRERVA